MTTATDMVAFYLNAEIAVLKGKQVTFGERTLGRENLQEIIAGRKEWEARVRSEKNKATGNTAPYSVADFR